jgi:hypothetical protein
MLDAARDDVDVIGAELTAPARRSVVSRPCMTMSSSSASEWQPHRLVSVNDYDVEGARIHGEFVWHSYGSPMEARAFMMLRTPSCMGVEPFDFCR